MDWQNIQFSRKSNFYICLNIINRAPPMPPTPRWKIEIFQHVRTLNKNDLLVNPIRILNPAIKILSRDGRIRAIRRPRSNARSRDPMFLGFQGGCYIFKKHPFRNSNGLSFFNFLAGTFRGLHPSQKIDIE